MMRTVAAGTAPGSAPESCCGRAYTVLDLGFARGMFEVGASEAQGSNSSSVAEAGAKAQLQLQLQHLWLKGLSQGPAAAGATSVDQADVWVLLSWAFKW